MATPLTHVQQCPECRQEYATDPHSQRRPTSCRWCFYTICGTCVNDIPNKNTQSNGRACMNCGKGGAFYSNSPLIHNLSCQLLTQVRILQQENDRLKREQEGQEHLNQLNPSRQRTAGEERTRPHHEESLEEIMWSQTQKPAEEKKSYFPEGTKVYHDGRWGKIKSCKAERLFALQYGDGDLEWAAPKEMVALVKAASRKLNNGSEPLLSPENWEEEEFLGKDVYREFPHMGSYWGKVVKCEWKRTYTAIFPAKGEGDSKEELVTAWHEQVERWIPANKKQDAGWSLHANRQHSVPVQSKANCKKPPPKQYTKKSCDASRPKNASTKQDVSFGPPTDISYLPTEDQRRSIGYGKFQRQAHRIIYIAKNNETPQQIADKFQHIPVEKVLYDNQRQWEGLQAKSRLKTGTTIVLPLTWNGNNVWMSCNPNKKQKSVSKKPPPPPPKQSATIVSQSSSDSESHKESPPAAAAKKKQDAKYPCDHKKAPQPNHGAANVCKASSHSPTAAKKKQNAETRPPSNKKQQSVPIHSRADCNKSPPPKRNAADVSEASKHSERKKTRPSPAAKKNQNTVEPLRLNNKQPTVPIQSKADRKKPPPPKRSATEAVSGLEQPQRKKARTNIGAKTSNERCQQQHTARIDGDESSETSSIEEIGLGDKFTISPLALGMGWKGFDRHISDSKLPTKFREILQLMDALFLVARGERGFIASLWTKSRKKGMYPGEELRLALRGMKEKDPAFLPWHTKGTPYVPNSKDDLADFIEILLGLELSPRLQSPATRKASSKAKVVTRGKSPSKAKAVQSPQLQSPKSRESRQGRGKSPSKTKGVSDGKAQSKAKTVQSPKLQSPTKRVSRQGKGKSPSKAKAVSEVMINEWLTLPATYQGKGWEGFNESMSKHNLPKKFLEVFQLMDFFFPMAKRKESFVSCLYDDKAERPGGAIGDALRRLKKKEPKVLKWHAPSTPYVPNTKKELASFMELLMNMDNAPSLADPQLLNAKGRRSSGRFKT